MRLSFVIPTRNQARFIGKCIDSCLAQRIDDAEVLVLDGASTDDTRDVLARYGDRIRWISERDRGQSDAVNKGIRMARGEVIAWINSDDYYAHDGVLAKVLATFAGGALDIVYGDGVMVDVQGAPIRTHGGRRLASAADIVISPASPLMQPAVFFTKALFDAVGGVDVDLHYTMDYELWIRMWQEARGTRYLAEQLVCATYHDDAKSVRGMRKQMAEAVVVKRRAADRLGFGTAERLRMYRGIAELYAYLIAVRLHLKRVA